jgi:uncharacterized protein
MIIKHVEVDSMKWSIQHLTRYQYDTLNFEHTLQSINESYTHPDILSMEPIYVQGRMVMREGKFVFDLYIETVLHMACAISLQDVAVPLHIEVEEIFSDDPVDHLILGNEIDLEPIVWMNIIAEKPMRVVAKDAKRTFEDAEEPGKIHPGLKDLEKFK